jgi:hypothetical protein
MISVRIILRGKHIKKFGGHWVAAVTTLFLNLMLGACFHDKSRTSRILFICLLKEDAVCWKHFDKDMTSWLLTAWWVKYEDGLVRVQGFKPALTGLTSVLVLTFSSF